MPRYTISHHIGSPSGDHYDFMLEEKEALLTYRLRFLDFSNPQIVIQSFDHRKKYLDYEGPLSQNRGSVSIWDTGEYSTIARTEREWVLHLKGKKLECDFILRSIPEKEKFFVLLRVDPGRTTKIQTKRNTD